MIQMDWERGAFRDVMFPGDSYMQAVANVPKVAEQLAWMIRSLERHFNLNITENTHIIGSGLGAHVAGFTGYYLQNDLRRVLRDASLSSKFYMLEGRKLLRISGLATRKKRSFR